MCAASRQSRVLLIGLDGADPVLMRRWMDEGRLPNLAALRAEGAFLPCVSTVPAATFPAWTTAVTGVNPGRHGVFDFTEYIPMDRSLRFVNATHRKMPAIWTLASQEGRRVCVLGVPGTYPPEPVNGVFVSGFDSPVTTRVDRSFVYPQDVYPCVHAWRFADFQESHIGPDWHARALPKLLEGIAAKTAAAVELLRQEHFDFTMIVFGESDTVAHHFWRFHDAESPRHTPGPSNAIRLVYERLDVAVGALRAALPDALTLVVSDHGFGGADTLVWHINNWLAEHGLLRFAPPRRQVLKRAALRFVPARWQGTLFRRLAGLAARTEAHARTGGIDWSATRAWSEELGYFPSIRINLRGRDPAGLVAPEEYVSFRDELCALLETCPAVRRAWPREALYSGPHVESAPDVVIELALENAYSPCVLRARGGPGLRRLELHEFNGGKERGMNGAHRPVGVLFSSRPANAQQTRLEDIAPTVLAALDVPAPPMEGVNLFGSAPDGHRPEESVHSSVPYTTAQTRAIETRLRALGYLE